ncbi:MAG: hypothetical protein CL916_15380 [Deltaproteobacteria bacterium]|nr:hypothetical protein [Deltaproteobacteria bacterium]
MTFFLLFLTSCTDQKALQIKEDTKMRLWFARNTVLLFEQCYKDLNLKEDSTAEESKAALERQKNLCDKYREKETKLLEICSKEIPASINSEHAPNSDEEYEKAKKELLKICSVVEVKNQK